MNTADDSLLRNVLATSKKEYRAMDMFLNPANVTTLIKTAEREGEVIVVRCVRKGKASKPGGPDVGDLYDLHCAQKPQDYVPAGTRSRVAEDSNNGVLTVYATNRQDPVTKQWGQFRRVNISEVQKVIYRGQEIEVRVS
jgi:hypothetical protein